jgi:hypothetical protein
MATVCLMIATFLNPFGFDILVYKMTELLNNYWTTMYILYGLAFLLFLLSYFLFKIGKRALGNMFITLGLFLNPLGYDLVVYNILLLTDNYWLTMVIMYGLSFLFFVLFLHLDKTKITSHVKNKTMVLHNKIKKIITKK